jgi:hypothetical protein
MEIIKEKIIKFVEGFEYVQKHQILGALDFYNIERVQNCINELVNEDVLAMKENPIDGTWHYCLSYMYKNSPRFNHLKPPDKRI